MPRKKLVRSSDFPYHLTARVTNREKFPTDLDYVWKTLCAELYLQAKFHGMGIHAFVMMANHFHLIATFRERDVDLVMKEVMGSATRIINTRSRRSGHLFGARYYWSLIGEAAYYAHALKYVFRNPVKAGLCDWVGDYPYSTYAGQIGEVPLLLPQAMAPKEISRLVPFDEELKDQWLNLSHPSEQNEAIRKALRRKEFRFPVQRSNRRQFEFPV